MNSSSTAAKAIALLGGTSATCLMIALTLAFGTSVVATTSACDPAPDSGADGADGSSSSSSSSGVAATPNALRSIDYRTLCNRLINECAQPTTSAECNKAYQHLLVTGACNTQISTASCVDLTTPGSTALNVCFPRCTSSTLSKCNGDGTLTQCTAAGTQVVADCTLSCLSDGYSSFTGTCGSTYKGEVAQQDQCWCQ